MPNFSQVPHLHSLSPLSRTAGCRELGFEICIELECWSCDHETFHHLSLPHENLLGLMFAQRKIVAPHLDLDGITERGKTDQFHGCPDQQTHLQDAPAMFDRNLNFSDNGALTDFQRSQRLGSSRHLGGETLRRLDLLNPDKIGELRTEAQPRITDLTNEIGVSAEQFDALLLTKAKFPQTFAHFRGSRELLDSHRNTRLHLAQLTERR
jgi:hypothetical protein